MEGVLGEGERGIGNWKIESHLLTADQPNPDGFPDLQYFLFSSASYDVIWWKRAENDDDVTTTRNGNGNNTLLDMAG